MALPEHLRSHVEMLRAVFPQGVCGGCRTAPYVLLFDEFSERNLAEVLADLLDEDRHVVLNEAIQAVSGHKADPDLVASMRTLLTDVGKDFGELAG